jgi:hypothetical protein
MASLHGLTAMELNHLMAVTGRKGGQIRVGRIGHNQHPKTADMAGSGRRKERRTLHRGQEAGRSLHSHDADGIHPHGGNGRRLVWLSQATDLEPDALGTWGLWRKGGFGHGPTFAVWVLSKIGAMLFLRIGLWVKAGS